VALASGAAIAEPISFQGESDMNTFLLTTAAVAAGYALSVATWPSLRTALVGIENEIDDLRAKARALETRLRG
jgi:hypothetical protein